MNTTGGNKTDLTALMYSHGFGHGPTRNQGTPTYSADGAWLIFPAQISGSAYACTDHAVAPGASLDMDLEICDTATYSNCAILRTVTPGTGHGVLHPQTTRDNSTIFWGFWLGTVGTTTENDAGSLQWATFIPGTPPSIGTIQQSNFAGNGTVTGGASATALATSPTNVVVTITNGGGPFAVPPTISMSGGTGTFTSITPTLTGSTLTAITVHGATGYTTGNTPTISITYADNWYEPAESDGAIGTPTCFIYLTTDTVYPNSSYGNVGIAKYSLGGSAVPNCPPAGTFSFVSTPSTLPTGCYYEFWSSNARLDTVIYITSCFFQGPQTSATPLDIGMAMLSSGQGAVQMTGYNLAGAPEYNYPTLVSTPHQAYDGSYIVYNYVPGGTLQNRTGVTASTIVKYNLHLVPTQASGKTALSGKAEYK
jgi:hypothetical protein